MRLFRRIVRYLGFDKDESVEGPSGDLVFRDYESGMARANEARLDIRNNEDMRENSIDLRVEGSKVRVVSESRDPTVRRYNQVFEEMERDYLKLMKERGTGPNLRVVYPEE